MSASTLFQHDAKAAAANLPRRSFVRTALAGYMVKRKAAQDYFQDWQSARQAASEIKYEGVNHLDRYLEEFTRNAEARGTKVFWASNSGQARDYIIELCREKGVQSIVK